jgi:hypothetical protein
MEVRRSDLHTQSICPEGQASCTLDVENEEGHRRPEITCHCPHVDAQPWIIVEAFLQENRRRFCLTYGPVTYASTISTQTLTLNLFWHENSPLPIPASCVDYVHHLLWVLPCQSTTHNRNWGVSTVLCSTHSTNWRRRCSSHGCNSCTDCAWERYSWFSHRVRHTPLWESNVTEVWRMLLGGLLSTMCNTCFTSRTFPFPTANACMWHESACFSQITTHTLKHKFIRLYPTRTSILIFPQCSERIFIPKTLNAYLQTQHYQ